MLIVTLRIKSNWCKTGADIATQFFFLPTLIALTTVSILELLCAYGGSLSSPQTIQFYNYFTCLNNQCFLLYQHNAIPGYMNRVFLLNFVTESHKEQFEWLFELYIDPRISLLNPRTHSLLPGNISSWPQEKRFFRAAGWLFIS